MPGTIVLVEDNPDIAHVAGERLAAEGFEVHYAHDGLEGVALIERVRPDLVVLDLMLPGLDGLEVCRRIQAERRVPVVMLTAKDAESDILVGLGVGADDYLTKPFSPRELVARVRAVLRRTSADLGDTGEQITVGDITIDVEARRVVGADGPVHLTPTEFDILAILARARGRVLSRLDLLEHVWGFRDDSGVRTVDSHVRGLRRKLGPDVVRTVHSVGYAVGEAI